MTINFYLKSGEVKSFEGDSALSLRAHMLPHFKDERIVIFKEQPKKSHHKMICIKEDNKSYFILFDHVEMIEVVDDIVMDVV